MHLVKVFSTTLLAFALTSFGAPRGSTDLDARDLLAIIVIDNDGHGTIAEACSETSCDAICRAAGHSGGDCDDNEGCVCEGSHTPLVSFHAHEAGDVSCDADRCTQNCRGQGFPIGLCTRDGRCGCTMEMAISLLETQLMKPEEMVHGGVPGDEPPTSLVKVVISNIDSPQAKVQKKELWHSNSRNRGHGLSRVAQACDTWEDCGDCPPIYDVCCYKEHDGDEGACSCDSSGREDHCY